MPTAYNMGILNNRTALVTGASRGIGRAIALRFASEGADVVFTDLKADEASESLLEELSAKGIKASFFTSDAASFQDAEVLMKQVLEVYGNLDILVNNAGITRDNLLLRMTEEDFDAVLRVNLKSVFNMTKTVQSHMIRKRSGSIINISSIVGLGGNPGQANYAASKAGIIGFSKSVAKELGGRNVRCNVIAPGFIDTAMTRILKEDLRQMYIQATPLRRPGKMEEVADAALFLASDMSSFLTGQVIRCDGGYEM